MELLPWLMATSEGHDLVTSFAGATFTVTGLVSVAVAGYLELKHQLNRLREAKDK